MDIEELIEERKCLQKLVDEATQRLATAPDGHFTQKRCNGGISYYLNSGQSIKYFSKRKNPELFDIYLQKRQDLKIIRHIPEQIKVIDSFLANYTPQMWEKFIEPKAETEEKIDKSVSDASTENSRVADDTDLARNLIAICSAFLQSKGC